MDLRKNRRFNARLFCCQPRSHYPFKIKLSYYNTQSFVTLLNYFACVMAKIEKLPEKQQDAIASHLMVLHEESEKLLLEQLASTETVVWSPYNAHEAAQTLSELLAVAGKCYSHPISVTGQN